jgi:hypothetical protein
MTLVSPSSGRREEKRMLLAATVLGGVEKLTSVLGRRLQLEVVDGHIPPCTVQRAIQAI